MVLAPTLAALSAWDASRWRSLAVISVRSWPELLFRHLITVAAITGVTFAISLAILGHQWTPESGRPRLDVLATGLWMIVAYAAVGFILGRLLAPVVAAISAFTGVWLWVAYTPALEPFWLRNVTGNLAASCCWMDVELTDHALSAPALIGSSLIVTAVMLLQWPRWWAAVISLTMVTASVTVSAHWMADVGADPLRERTTARECVTHDGITLCAWPEHHSKLTVGAASLAATVRRLEAAGVAIPHHLDEGATSDEGGWSFTLSADEPDYWPLTLAHSPMNAIAECGFAHVDSETDTPLEELTTAWLLSTAGFDNDTVTDHAEVAPAELQALLARSAEAQAAWYATTLNILSTCDTPS